MNNSSSSIQTEESKTLADMETSSSEKKLHIVMFPWLAYGHLLPFLEVSKFFAAENGHRISFISTPKNIQFLLLKNQLLDPLIHFVELPLPPVPGLPETAESTSELPISKVQYLKKAYDKMEPSLVEFLRKTGDVDCVVHDVLPYWLPRATAQLGIHSVVFSIFNASSLAFVGPPNRLLNEMLTPEDLTAVPDWIPYPTTVAFRLYDLLNLNEAMDSDMSDLVRLGKSISGSTFVMVRSCPEFESEQLIFLEKLYEKPVIPTGLLPPRLSTPITVNQTEEKWKVLQEWLQRKEEKSVLYIAFGTEIALKQELLNELAFGVEKSGLSFVWVVKDGCSLPPGFEERVTSGKGFIWKGWAPQLDILAHASIGGFLTHCGWSSVIEGLSFGRALILFSGGNADQGLVARLLQERGVGVEIERDFKDGSFSRDGVAAGITRVMVDSMGEKVRAKAWEMREIFGNVDLQEKYLHQLARSLTQIIK